MRIKWPLPVAAIFRWMDRRAREEQIGYAAAQYALALAANDYRRAWRLRRILDDLNTAD